LAEDEQSKQKPEARKKKRFSSVTLEKLEILRQWQTFILALIIIVAYIVFFGWIISISSSTDTPSASNTANTSDTPNTPDQSKKEIDYSGMTTLTGTFGIIAAAVVGYYFGTRNLKQATDMAQQATDVAKQTQGEVEVKKAEVENEAKDHVQNMEKGKSIYTDLKKFFTLATENPEKPVKEIPNLDYLKKTVEERIKEIDLMLAGKERTIKAIESTKSEK